MVTNRSDTREIGLVLGGGGARGFAHIGAARAIAEAGLRPAAIAGTSMGAIIGGLIAAGHDADAMLEMAEEVNLPSLLDFGERGGLIGGKNIEAYLASKLPERFEDLEIPLLVTAVDLQTGELVVLRKGPLVPALRASSALPGLLSPARLGDRIFVDGGVLDNVPVDAIGTATLAPVVAVDVSPPMDRPIEFGDDESWWERVASTWRRDQRALLIEVLIKSSELTQRLNTELRLALHPPKVLVRADLPTDMGVEDFGRTEEAVEAGYRSAVAALSSSDLVGTPTEDA